MKTEVTIPDALVTRLKEAADVAQISFDQALEKALYAGVGTLPQKTIRKPYRLKPHHFGKGLENPKEVLARMDEEHDFLKLRVRQ